MSIAWQAQRETGSQCLRRVLVWMALHLGRTVVVLILYPTVLYFLLFSTAIRNASQDYLRRVLGKPARVADVCRHLFTFALCSVDRLYFLSGKSPSYDICVSGENVFDPYIVQKRGAILLVTHLGNFDVMRVRGVRERQLPVKILLSRTHNAGANALIEQLDPALAQSVIDADRPANELVLEIRQALDAGFFVGIMADRVKHTETVFPCQFLGTTADFPASPWLLAAVLKAPVILCFGLFAGGRRYDLIFEEFSPALVAARKTRQTVLAAEAQRFVDRVQFHLMRYPYNWFNFYPFWRNETPEN